jgi:hemolysin activation/secretion protein
MTSSGKILAASIGIAMWCALSTAIAQELPKPDADLQRQEQQIKELRQRLEAATPVLAAPEQAAGLKKLPTDEAPCFTVQSMQIEGALPAFGDLQQHAAGIAQDDTPVGKCLGVQGIQIVAERLQNQLIAQGFVTTRVDVPAQDLKSGVLTLSVLAGRLGKVMLQGKNDWTF